jgi:hypothetical protein
LPGEDSSFGSGTGIRFGGLIDEECADIRDRGYQGIVPSYQAVGCLENWPQSIQEEVSMTKNRTIYAEERKRKKGTAEFIPLDDRFWASLDGKPIMNLGQALDSAHGLITSEIDFSEPLAEAQVTDGEEEQETETLDDEHPSFGINDWIRERYGDLLEEQEINIIHIPVPEKEIQVSSYPYIERKKIFLGDVKLHELCGLRSKKPPQKKRLCCRSVRHQQLRSLR